MVWNYQNADCSLRKKFYCVICYNLRHTFVPYSNSIKQLWSNLNEVASLSKHKSSNPVTKLFINNYNIENLSSVFWRCWLGCRKGIRPVKNLSGEVLTLLSVWSEVQTCIWPSWCHKLSLASVKSRLVLPFWYRPTRIVPEKGPLNGCVCIYIYIIYSVHIFKRKGDRSVCDDHRGISLLCIPGNILARIILNRLVQHVNGHDILPESQCGFRGGRSTMDMIFTAWQLQ